MAGINSLNNDGSNVSNPAAGVGTGAPPPSSNPSTPSVRGSYTPPASFVLSRRSSVSSAQSLVGGRAPSGTAVPTGAEQVYALDLEKKEVDKLGYKAFAKALGIGPYICQLADSIVTQFTNNASAVRIST